MKSIILILISLLFSVGGDSIKFKFDPSKYSKNLKLNNIIPTNNENNILSKEHLLPYQINELKQQAKEYTPIPVTSDDIVIMETTRGTMKIELYNDIAPKHCYNFKLNYNYLFY